jgi:hypothetical protein
MNAAADSPIGFAAQPALFTFAVAFFHLRHGIGAM